MSDLSDFAKDLIEALIEFDPICDCGEPGYACICCWKCGATNKYKHCVCDEVDVRSA